ncbi:MAG: phosphoribosyltransferase [Candidatus Magasanikbacteria bacterium]|nr:phosphoribosyltransferase [Candidatus Magasanikbacteria bacterium]
MLFSDRREAGTRLAKLLGAYQRQSDAVVLGLPRGGAVTAAAVARALNLPLDIIVARKIGAPHNEEYAIGAVTEQGEPLLDEGAIAALEVTPEYLEKTIAAERREASRRRATYRGQRPPLKLAGQTAILIDDGVATGATMRAAIREARALGAAKVIVATPVIARDTLERLRAEANEVIYLDAPLFFGAVGAFYENFAQTTDEEVINLLK